MCILTGLTLGSINNELMMSLLFRNIFLIEIRVNDKVPHSYLIETNISTAVRCVPTYSIMDSIVQEL